MWRDDATVLDILKAARLATGFVSGQNKAEFIKDIKTQSAVAHQILIIGEAVKRLSDDFRSQHNTIPWGDIAGMRDKIIHGYDDVDLNAVWTALSGDIPELITFLESVSKENDIQ